MDASTCACPSMRSASLTSRSRLSPASISCHGPRRAALAARTASSISSLSAACTAQISTSSLHAECKRSVIFEESANLHWAYADDSGICSTRSPLAINKETQWLCIRHSIWCTQLPEEMLSHCGRFVSSIVISNVYVDDPLVLLPNHEKLSADESGMFW
jgi:hypothetical protein